MRLAGIFLRAQKSFSTLDVYVKIDLFEFFAISTKLPVMAMLASKDFTAVKKVTSSGVQLDNHWIKSLMLVLLS